jgi:16S rRNA (uracil1498-N3)-methyltransferase
VNEALRRSAAHVFVESLDAPDIGSDDLHHLQRVLRIGPRDTVTLSDGRGAWAAATVGAGGEVELSGPAERIAPPTPIGVATALVKGDRVELVVQKLTELGVDRIWFFAAARSVVRWEGDRRTRHVERLRRIAREAAMQSRRVWLPEVELVSWADIMAAPGAVRAEPGSTGSVDACSHLVVIGPEGGFDPDEQACGLASVSLGDQVLRVETAAIAAGVLLAAARRARR